MRPPTTTPTTPTVEDSRTGVTASALERAVRDHLTFTLGRDHGSVTEVEAYQALALAVRDRMMRRWMATRSKQREANPKYVAYLSAEYLPGRWLTNNLLGLGLLEEAREAVSGLGFELDALAEVEEDPGLGNGGLGRLAACFMDSLATLDLPAYGYGIRYQFGIFRQEIRDGHQIELPDQWLRAGNPWEVARPDCSVEVAFGGEVREHEDGSREWIPDETVLGVPHDTPIVGYRTNRINTLRLWRARASEEFDLQVFNDGDYRRAVERKTLSETISKVLYPNDRSREGRELRLRQQYFFCACSIQDVMRRFERHESDYSKLSSHVQLHLNDTHPAVAVPELLRVLMDEKGLSFEAAWEVCRDTFAYTNHTLLPEALETWSLPLFESLLPRHLELIYLINSWHLERVALFAPGDGGRTTRMSLIDELGERRVRMAWLSTVASHSVNGVAALHSDLVRKNLLNDFAEMWPDRFNNKTNGVTPRRWMLQCNPELASVITEAIGPEWPTDLARLEGLLPLADDAGFRQTLRDIKNRHKVQLARIVRDKTGIRMDPHALLDTQVKRIHEYKRQLMNCLHAVDLYRRIKFEGEDLVPRTILIGGKAAPGYVMAKLHIKLIHDVARVIDADPATSGRLKLVFLPNYNVSLAERVIPATDLSEQISMAGKEASGTGNMKFQMNGALTIGTLDGANVEIREEVGPENFFLFGLSTDEVKSLKQSGYDPEAWAGRSEALSACIELIASGFFCRQEPDRYHQLIGYLLGTDPYLICADFDAYAGAHRAVEEAWRTPSQWQRAMAINIAKSGKFSSDRTIAQYASEIWKLQRVPV